MTAVLLARAGKDVLVLEARTVGACATGNTTAKISLLQGSHLSKILSKHGAGVARAYMDGNREGQSWLLQHCEARGVAVQREDAYTYAQSSSGVGSARSELEACQAVGLPATWEDDANVPFPYHGGVRLAGQAQFDPVEFLDALALELIGHGGRLVEHTRVRRVSGHGKSLRVHVNDAAQREVQLSAAQLVLATGIPILDRGGYFARVKPARSYCFAFEVPGEVTRPMMISTDSPTRSVRYAPVADGERLIVGGAGHTVGREKSPSKALGGTVFVDTQALPGSGGDPFLVGAGLHADRRPAIRRTHLAGRRKYLHSNGFQQVGNDERRGCGVGAVKPTAGWADGLVERVRQLEPARTFGPADGRAVQSSGRIQSDQGLDYPVDSHGPSRPHRG